MDVVGLIERETAVISGVELVAEHGGGCVDVVTVGG